MKKNGFTLIELLIVTTLSIMLMLTASAVFLTFLIGSSKTTLNQEVKNEGKYALSQMEFLLRNAIEILPNSQDITCGQGMDEIKFRSFDNGVTTLFKEQEKIASNSGVFLTSAGVEIVEGPIFDCAMSDDKVSQYISVSFTLRKSGVEGSTNATEVAEETFTSSINIRSY